MAQGIKWVDGIKIFVSEYHGKIEDEVNTWLEQHKAYNIKSINFVSSKFYYNVWVHYQKPSGEWE